MASLPRGFSWRRGGATTEVRIPRALIRPGPNDLRFCLAYAESPATGGSRDRRSLSVAFALLEAYPDGP